MSFFSRLGTESHKFNIEISVERLIIQPSNLTIPICVKLIRGNKISKTDFCALNKDKRENNHFVEFNNKSLNCISTLYSKSNKYLKKEARLSVFQSNKGLETEIGRVDFNLAEFVKSPEFIGDKTFPLTKCEDKAASIKVKFHTVHLKGIDEEHGSPLGEAKVGNNHNEGKSTDLSQSKNSINSDEEDEEEESGSEDDDEDTKPTTRKPTTTNNNKPNNTAKPLGKDGKPAAKPGAKPTAKSAKDDDSDSEESSSGSEGSDESDSETGKSNKKVQFNSKPLGATSKDNNGAATNKSALKPTGKDDNTNKDTKNSGKWGSIFSCSLEDAMVLKPVNYTSKTQLEIPYILDFLLNFLESNNSFMQTKDLFKTLPNPEKKENAIKQIESGTDLNKIITNNTDPNLVAALIKHFITNLTPPVIPAELNTQCVAIGKRDIDGDEKGAHDDEQSNGKQKQNQKNKEDDDDDDEDEDDDDEEENNQKKPPIREDLVKLMPKLPVLNRKVLYRLTTFFKKLSAPEFYKKNNMNIHSLLIVFSPTLLKLDKSKYGAYELFTESSFVVNFFKHLCRYNHVLNVESNYAGTTSASAKSSSANNTNKKPPPKPVDSESEDSDEDSENNNKTNKPVAKPGTKPTVPAATTTAKKPAHTSDSEEDSEDDEDSTNNKKSANNINSKPLTPKGSNSSTSSNSTSDLAAELARLKLENESLKKSSNGSNSKESNNETAKKLSAVTKQKETLEKENKQLNEKLLKLNKQLEEANKKASSKDSGSSSKSIFGGNSAEIANLRTELNNMTTKYNEINNKYRTLKVEQDSNEFNDEKLVNLQEINKGLSSQVDILKIENDNLRGRLLTFDELNLNNKEIDAIRKANNSNSESNKIANKQKYQLLTAYEMLLKRNLFLESVVKETDETLTMAKSTWFVTNKVLQDQITRLEAELALLEKQLGETKLDVEKQEFNNNQKKLLKLDKKYNSLAEDYNRLELELTQKKLEIQQQKQRILELQDEKKQLNNQLIETGVALKTIANDNFELKEFMRTQTKGKKPNKKDSNIITNNTTNTMIDGNQSEGNTTSPEGTMNSSPTDSSSTSNSGTGLSALKASFSSLLHNTPKGK